MCLSFFYTLLNAFKHFYLIWIKNNNNGSVISYILGTAAVQNLKIHWLSKFFATSRPMSLSAGAVQFADCFTAKKVFSSNGCPGYDSKISDCKAAVLELWGMWGNTSLSLLPDQL